MQQWLLFILPTLEQVQVIFVGNEDAIDKLTKYEVHLTLINLDNDVFDDDRQDVKNTYDEDNIANVESMQNECREEVKTNAASLPSQFSQNYYESLADHICILIELSQLVSSCHLL